MSGQQGKNQDAAGNLNDQIHGHLATSDPDVNEMATKKSHLNPRRHS